MCDLEAASGVTRLRLGSDAAVVVRQNSAVLPPLTYHSPSHQVLSDVFLLLLENPSTAAPADCPGACLLVTAPDASHNVWHSSPISEAPHKHWFDASVTPSSGPWPGLGGDCQAPMRMGRADE